MESVKELGELGSGERADCVDRRGMEGGLFGGLAMDDAGWLAAIQKVPSRTDR